MARTKGSKNKTTLITVQKKQRRFKHKKVVEPEVPQEKRYYNEAKLFSPIQSGNFYCYTHLRELPISEQSIDPRYCKVCYESLTSEIKMAKIANSRLDSSEWIPIIPQDIKN